MNIADVFNEIYPSAGRWTKEDRRNETYKVAPRMQRNVLYSFVGKPNLEAKQGFLTTTLRIDVLNTSTSKKASLEICTVPIWKAVVFDDGQPSIGIWNTFKAEDLPLGSTLESIGLYVEKDDMKQLCDKMESDKISSVTLRVALRRRNPEKDDEAEVVQCGFHFEHGEAVS